MKFDPISGAVCADVGGVLRAHAGLLDSLDLGAASEEVVVDLVRSNERCARLLAGVSTAASVRLDELGGLSGADVLSTAGKLSDHAARNIERRGRLVGSMPSVGAGCIDGTIPAAHVDAVAGARHKLRHDPVWQARFDARDASIARKAKRMDPTRFRRWLSDLVDRISDDSETDTRTEEDKNTASVWTGRDGRIKGHFDLDPINGEIVGNALAA